MPVMPERLAAAARQRPGEANRHTGRFYPPLSAGPKHRPRSDRRGQFALRGGNFPTLEFTVGSSPDEPVSQASARIALRFLALVLGLAAGDGFCPMAPSWWTRVIFNRRPAM